MIRTILPRGVVADICDIFQDFIDSKDITISSTEKDEAIKEGADALHPTTIYGSDWDFLETSISQVLAENGIEITIDYDGHMVEDLNG